MDNGFRCVMEITMSSYLNLLKYKQAYLEITDGNKIPLDYTLECEAIQNANNIHSRYKIKQLERIEYNK